MIRRLVFAFVLAGSASAAMAVAPQQASVDPIACMGNCCDGTNGDFCAVICSVE
jgi:hypothetical protein